MAALSITATPSPVPSSQTQGSASQLLIGLRHRLSGRNRSGLGPPSSQKGAPSSPATYHPAPPPCPPAPKLAEGQTTAPSCFSLTSALLRNFWLELQPLAGRPWSARGTGQPGQQPSVPSLLPCPLGSSSNRCLRAARVFRVSPCHVAIQNPARPTRKSGPARDPPALPLSHGPLPEFPGDV